MQNLRRPIYFFIVSTLWFLITGPLIAVVLPHALPFAYIVGGIPALVTGGAFSYYYRKTPVPNKVRSRAYMGAIFGALCSSTLFILAYLVFNHGIPNFQQDAQYRIELESTLAGLVALAAIGAIAGAFAAALMPQRLRNLGQ